MLYPQNGDRIVTIDSATSLHPVYKSKRCADCKLPVSALADFHKRSQSNASIGIGRPGDDRVDATFKFKHYLIGLLRCYCETARRLNVYTVSSTEGCSRPFVIMMYDRLDNRWSTNRRHNSRSAVRSMAYRRGPIIAARRRFIT